MPSHFNADDLQFEIESFLADYGHQQIDEFDLGGALNEMMAIIRRYKIILPSRVSLLIKVLVMLV